MNFVILCLTITTVCATGGLSTSHIDADVWKAVENANRLIQRGSNDFYHYRVVKVAFAEKQVVAGLDYHLKFFVAPTTCRRSTVSLREQIWSSQSQCRDYFIQRYFNSLFTRNFGPSLHYLC